MVPLSKEVADVYSLFNSLVLKDISNGSSSFQEGTGSRALVQNNKGGKTDLSQQRKGRHTGG